MQISDCKKDKRTSVRRCVEPSDLKVYFSIWMLSHIRHIEMVFHLNAERAYGFSDTVDWVPNNHTSNNCIESMNAAPCASEGTICFWACFFIWN